MRKLVYSIANNIVYVQLKFALLAKCNQLTLYEIKFYKNLRGHNELILISIVFYFVFKWQALSMWHFI